MRLCDGFPRIIGRHSATDPKHHKCMAVPFSTMPLVRVLPGEADAVLGGSERTCDCAAYTPGNGAAALRRKPMPAPLIGSRPSPQAPALAVLGSNPTPRLARLTGIGALRRPNRRLSVGRNAGNLFRQTILRVPEVERLLEPQP